MAMASIWYAGKAAFLLGDIVSPLYADEVVLEKKLKKVAEYTHKPYVPGSSRGSQPLLTLPKACPSRQPL
jgi:hypothetical protein